MWVPAAGAPAPGALAGELSQLQARRAEAAHPELHDRSFALLQRCLDHLESQGAGARRSSAPGRQREVSGGGGEGARPPDARRGGSTIQTRAAWRWLPRLCAAVAPDPEKEMFVSMAASRQLQDAERVLLGRQPGGGQGMGASSDHLRAAHLLRQVLLPLLHTPAHAPPPSPLQRAPPPWTRARWRCW